MTWTAVRLGPRYYTLHYYLADDTIEMLENLPRTFRVEPFGPRPNVQRCQEFRGGPLPDLLEAISLEEESSHCAHPWNAGAPAGDLQTRGGPLHSWEGGMVGVLIGSGRVPLVVFRSAWRKDLIVGDTIDVMGREIVLYDCDDFTRNFYTSYMGLEQEFWRP